MKNKSILKQFLIQHSLRKLKWQTFIWGFQPNENVKLLTHLYIAFLLKPRYHIFIVEVMNIEYLF